MPSPSTSIHFERKAVHDPFIARAGAGAMMNSQQCRQRTVDPETVRPPRAGPDAGRLVRARTLLTGEECAMVERIEKETGAPAFVHFRLLDASLEARLDGSVPAGAVVQRTEAGIVTGQAIVGG